jgi:hypothetical protein
MLRIGFQTERNGEECIWIPQTEILNRVVAFCWPRNRIEDAIANTPGRALSAGGKTISRHTVKRDG